MAYVRGIGLIVSTRWAVVGGIVRLLISVVTLLSSLALGQVPEQLGYQGRLLKADGTPVAGLVDITFRIHGARTGGTALWGEQQRVALSDGYYSVALGATTALPAGVLSGVERYLAIEVGGEELTPRLPILSVPYALAAVTAENLAPKLGLSESMPATSCAALLGARPGIASGPYWLKPPTAKAAFRAYCDMTNEGGGWTLVWSNLRGGRGKPVTDLQWSAAVNTLPLTRGTLSADLESFLVYTGLVHWTPLAPSGKLRYDWIPNYGQNLDQRAVMSFSLDAGQNYKLTLSNFVQSVGNSQPGLWIAHNGMQFTTYDADHDQHDTNCSSSYTNSPWWYTRCWDGSINGGGEVGSASHFNGAYWVGSAASWGAAGGTGAGNGWIYVK